MIILLAYSNNNKNTIFTILEWEAKLWDKTADAPYVRRFVEETLGALEEYDRCNHTALLQTLEALIRSGGSRKETAEALFLHRNTLSNRIQKLEQITGCNLSDSDSRFRLELALKYRNFC